MIDDKSNEITQKLEVEEETNKTQRLRRSSRSRTPVVTYLQEITAENNTNNESNKNCLKCNIHQTPLETIFEEPKENNNKIQYMSVRKIKRLKNVGISFKRFTNIKLKRLRNAGISNRKYRNAGEKVTIDTVLEKLAQIE